MGHWIFLKREEGGAKETMDGGGPGAQGLNYVQHGTLQTQYQ